MPPLPPLDHRRGKQLDQQKRSTHVDCSGASQLVFGHILELPDWCVGGVVDKEADGYVEAADPLFHAVEIGHVSGYREHLDAVAVDQSVRCRLQLVRVTCEQHQVYPPAGQRLGERGAQSVGTAGDQRVRPELLDKSCRHSHRLHPTSRLPYNSLKTRQ